MVPWPIAGLSLFYGVLAACSAATLWKIASGALDRSFVWPLGWLAVSAGLMVGLALLEPWARRWAAWSSTVIAGMALAVAAQLIATHRPLWALLATCGAGCQVVVARYLTRPQVRAWFTCSVPGTNGAVGTRYRYE